MTLFAPSNPAFQAIGSAASGLSDTDLANILGYHLVPSRILFSPRLLAQDQIVLATLQGSNLTIRRDGNQLFVNSARVILGDVLVGNGVVHVIDKYAHTPPPPNLPTHHLSWVSQVADIEDGQCPKPIQHIGYP